MKQIYLMTSRYKIIARFTYLFFFLSFQFKLIENSNNSDKEALQGEKRSETITIPLMIKQRREKLKPLQKLLMDPNI